MKHRDEFQEDVLNEQLHQPPSETFRDALRLVDDDFEVSAIAVALIGVGKTLVEIRDILRGSPDQTEGEK